MGIPTANRGGFTYPHGTPTRSGLFESTIAIGNGRYRTVLEFVDQAVAMVDNAGVGAHAGLEIYDFPEGLWRFEGAVLNLAITKSSAGVNADWDGDIGLGTVVADTGATLASTEQDLVPTTATPQAVAGATTGNGVSTSTEAPKLFDGTATAKKAFLNVLVDDADHDVTTTPCNLIFNGTVSIDWANVGDK